MGSSGAASSFSACWQGGWEGKLPGQATLLKWYEWHVIQISVAMIIVLNFFCTIAEKEIDPFERDLQQFPQLWVGLDWMFTSLFVFELLVNMYASWLMKFWRSGWNVFDFIIVLISVLNLTGALSGAGFLKTLRTFRVFRLFKRIKALNKIITSLILAIPGMMNAFLIMLIVISIYAIIGVELFATFGDGGEYTTVQQIGVEPSATYPVTYINSTTDRGFYYGREYFGTFSRALFTQFQVLTGESWAEVVVRPLLFGFTPGSAIGVSFYFVSYILILQIILVNVVVAVLLDKFVAQEEPEQGDDSAWDGEKESDEEKAARETANEEKRARRKSAAETAKSLAVELQNVSMGLEEARLEMAAMSAQLEGVQEMRSQMTQLVARMDEVLAHAGGAPIRV